MFNYFAESSIDIQLKPYDNEIIVQVEQNKVLNLIIGRLKEGINWPEVYSDSVLIEFERFNYLKNNELPELLKHIQKRENPILCFHFDKRVPIQVKTDILTKLKNAMSTCETIESRFNGEELVYINLNPTDKN
mgnify:CR=1 FL=1